MKFNTEEVNRLMHERRSVFLNEYSGARVDDAVIVQILKNANWAPTHKLTEPWRFVVFCDQGLQKLAEFQASCYKRVTGADGTFREDRMQGLMTKPLQCSHVIAVGMKRDDKNRIPEIEETGAVFCAIQNMYLTATAYGVGCYLSTGGITYFEEAKEFFGLGPADRLLGFLNVGMPKGEVSENRKRRPVDEKVTWIR